MTLDVFRPTPPTMSTISVSLHDVQVGNALTAEVAHETESCPVSTLGDTNCNIYQRGATEKASHILGFPFVTRWHATAVRSGQVTVFATAHGSPRMRLLVEERFPEMKC